MDLPRRAQSRQITSQINGFPGGLGCLDGPLTYHEQLTDQWMSPGVADLLRRAQNKQINRFRRGSWNPGGPRGSQHVDITQVLHTLFYVHVKRGVSLLSESYCFLQEISRMDFPGGRGSPEESAEPTDQPISPGVLESRRTSRQPTC